MKQKGYIKIVLVVFALLIGVMIFPMRYPAPATESATEVLEEECRVGQSGGGESVFLPPIINAGAARDLPGGWDTSKPNVEYVLIRKNVPIFMNTTDPNYALGYPDWMGRDEEAGNLKLKWPVITDTEYLGRNADPRHTILYPDANQPGFDVYYPKESGEVELPYLTTDRTGANITITSPNQTILTLRTEGFLIFVHLDANGDPIKMNYGQHIYYLVDFYQDKSLFETPDDVKGYNVEDIFHCLDPEAPSSTGVFSPPQEKSQTKDQIQLEWFVFGGQPGMYAHCKPAIYLYPEKKQLVNVKVFPKGELTYTDPPYPEGRGWTVEAWPDGSIYERRMTNDEKRYSYLYYESKLLDSEINKPSKGWVVRKGEMGDLFNRVLPQLGLNQKEKADFEDYWLNKLPESPYYFVGLVDKSQRDYLEALSVTPAPDTSIRFSFYFEPLENFVSVPEPLIITPERNGFTLVDWGGMIKLHPGTPFTCSQ